MCKGALGGGTENQSELLSHADLLGGAAPHLGALLMMSEGFPKSSERGGHRLPAEGMKPLNGSQS